MVNLSVISSFMPSIRFILWWRRICCHLILSLSPQLSRHLSRAENKVVLLSISMQLLMFLDHTYSQKRALWAVLSSNFLFFWGLCVSSVSTSHLLLFFCLMLFCFLVNCYFFTYIYLYLLLTSGKRLIESIKGGHSFQGVLLYVVSDMPLPFCKCRVLFCNFMH